MLSNILSHLHALTYFSQQPQKVSNILLRVKESK